MDPPSLADLEKQDTTGSSTTPSFVDFASFSQREPPKTAPVMDGLLAISGPAQLFNERYHRPSTPWPDNASVTTTARPSVTSFDDEPNWPSGWRPWGCLVGCFLLMWNSWGIVNAYGTYQSYYSQHLFASTSLMLLNLIGSTQSFVVLICSFIVGRLLDANYSRQLIGLGAVLVTLGHFLLSVVNGAGERDQGNYGATWATQGLLVGLGQACFFVSSSQIVSTWFIKRKAVAIGIVASGASIAGLVYPIMIKFLITEVGFLNAVRYNATLIAVTAIASFFLAVPNPSHSFRKPDKWLRTSVWIDSHAFRNPAFCWFTAGISFVFFGFYAIFFNLEDWAAFNGFAKKDTPPGFRIGLGQNEVDNDAIRTFWLLCIMNVSSTTGRIFSACFAERFGATNIHTVTTTVGSLLLLCLWPFAKTLSPALIFVIIFGAVSGSIIGLPPASIAHILGRTDPKAQAKLGQWTGMMYTCAAPFALTGPVIAGYLVQAYGPGQYLAVQMWSGACLLLAAVCMGVARFVYGGPSRTVDTLKGLSVSVVSLRLSRGNTIEKSDSGEKPGFLVGLGKIMKERKGSGDSAQSPIGGGVQTPEADESRGRS